MFNKKGIGLAVLAVIGLVVATLAFAGLMIWINNSGQSTSTASIETGQKLNQILRYSGLDDLNNGLFAYYSFNTTADAVLGLHNMTANEGSATFTETDALIGYSTNLSVDNNWKIPDADPFDYTGTSSGAINYWLRSPNIIASYPLVHYQGGGVGWTTGIESPDRIAVNYLTSGTGYGNQFYDDRWVMITISFNSSQVLIYTNGTLASTTARNSVTATNEDIYIGSTQIGSSEYVGLMDELGFWNRSLTTEEITALYNNGDGVDYSEFGSGGGGTTPPVVTLLDPEDAGIVYNSNIYFAGSFTSTATLANSTLYVWNETNDLIYNITEEISNSANSSNQSYSFSDYGNYHWNYEVYDNNSNFSFAGSNFTLSYQAIPSVPITLKEGLFAYYQFEDETDAVAGLHNMSGNEGGGGQFLADGGIIGSYGNLTVDGNWVIDDYVEFDYTGTSSGTINFWMYDDAFANSVYPLTHYQGGGVGWVTATGTSPNEIQAYYITSNLASGQLYEGEWIMTTLVFNSTTVQWYVNGTLSSTGSRSSVTATAENIYIGVTQINTSEYTGRIDELAFYNRTLNSTEIASLYNDGDGLTYEDIADAGNEPTPVDYRQPTYYWSFNDTSVINQTDTMSGLKLLGINFYDDGSDYVLGVSGKALNFSLGNDVDGKYLYTYNATFTGDVNENFTVAFWVYPKLNDTKYALVTTTANLLQGGFEFFMDGPGGAPYETGKLFIASGDGSSWTKVRTNSVLDANQWYFITGVFNSSGTFLFINGQFENSMTRRAINSSAGYLSVASGGTDPPTPSAQYYARANLDELRIWNFPLNETEINALYNNGTYVMSNTTTTIMQNVSLLYPENETETNDAFVDFSSLLYVANANYTNATLYVWDTSGEYYVEVNDTIRSNNTLLINYSTTLGIGTYEWNVYSCVENQTDGSCAWAENNYTLTVDNGVPIIEFTQISDQFISSPPINVSLNFTAIDVGDAGVDSCWFYTSDNLTNITFDCGVEETLTFTSTGVKTIWMYANDTFNNVNFTTQEFEIGTYLQEESVDPIAEGGQSTFTLILNKTAIGTPTASFTYNNTEFSPSTQVNNANSSIFTYVLTVPAGWGNSTGKLQFWNWTFSITGLVSNYSTTTQNQTVFSPSLSDCSSGGTLILNFTHYDEETREPINFSNGNNLQIDLTLTSLASSETAFVFNTTEIDSPELIVCVADGVLNSTSYRLDLTGSYVATDFVQEFFYIDNGTVSLSTVPQEYDWYDLLLADSTTFLFTFLDENGIEVPGVIVETLRYYIGQGEFLEVERSKEDNNGETHIHLVEEDVIYKFRITYNNEEIFLSDQYNAKCLSSPCAITLSAEPDNPQFPTTYNNLPEGTYRVEADRDTREVTLSFNLNQTATMNLSVYTQNNNEVELVASGTTTASSGDLTVTVPLSYGNATYSAVIYMDDQFVATRVVDLSERASDYFGALGLFLGALAVLCLALIGASHGEWVIVWTVLGLVTISTLYLVDLEWYALMTLVAGAGIFLIKLVSRRRVQ